MDFVWKLGLIWFGGAVVVCVAGIGMASVAAALASWLEPKSGWQPEPTIRDKALAAWNMFTRIFPIVLVIWPALAPFVLYMGCVGLIKLPGLIWRKYCR